jgi:type IV pilus assembly protein PilE
MRPAHQPQSPGRRPAASGARSATAESAGRSIHAFDPRLAAGVPRGFTLVELMMVIAVLAVLAAIAYPSYLDSVRKGRRAEASGALSALQQAQERWRANHALYGHLASPADAQTLPGIAATTANGHYTITVSGASATGYTATATAVGSQAADAACAVMGAQLLGGHLRFGSGASGIDWSAADPDAGRCWAR